MLNKLWRYQWPNHGDENDDEDDDHGAHDGEYFGEIGFDMRGEKLAGKGECETKKMPLKISLEIRGMVMMLQRSMCCLRLAVPKK